MLNIYRDKIQERLDKVNLRLEDLHISWDDLQENIKWLDEAKEIVDEYKAKKKDAFYVCCIAGITCLGFSCISNFFTRYPFFVFIESCALGGLINLYEVFCLLSSRGKYNEVIDKGYEEKLLHYDELLAREKELTAELGQNMNISKKYKDQLEFIDNGDAMIDEIMLENQEQYLECVSDYKKMLEEFLNESVDYSRVHFDGYEIPSVSLSKTLK